MNGIKMADCKFYVDENARTVVCVIPNTKNLLIDFVYKHFNYKDITMWDGITYAMSKKLSMPRSFSGKAVCAPGDEWDEETGRLIAFSRAKDKCYKSFFKRANYLIQSIDRRLGDMIETFNNFGMKLEEKRESLQNKIDEATGVDTEE